MAGKTKKKLCGNLLKQKCFSSKHKKLWLANEYAWECEKYIFKFYYLTQLNSTHMNMTITIVQITTKTTKKFVAVESPEPDMHTMNNFLLCVKINN